VNLFYVPLIGFPLCVILMATGLFLCCTLILAPVGLAVIALGFKVLTLKPRVIVAKR
jgi:uncharacterized membrane protein YccF (DUF307 family)